MQNFIDYLKKNFIYLIATLTIIFALVALLYIQIQHKPSMPTTVPIPVFSPSPTQHPTVTTVPISRPESGGKYQTISASDQEQIRRDSLVGQLLSKLPYTSTKFSLEYNYSNNQFIATLKTNQEDAGSKELDAFLQTNQIEDRSWLKNLIIKLQ